MVKKKLSPSQVLDMDATALLEAYREGTVTPGEAVEIYIAQQIKANGRLNLVASCRHEAAQQEAAKCDEQLKKGKIKGKLFGIPMTMKEAFDVTGMRTTGALRHMKDRELSTTDAEAVKRLREEGAVILNKSNTPSLCFCQETNNNLFGRSNNPWNPECTTGGSSGGEAGLIAIGAAAAGFGSDIGGSIRIPSHFNGVVGFKAGAFRFPEQGHLPEVTVENQKRMLGFGPIVKSVRDAALIYSIIEPSFKVPASWQLPKKMKVVSFGSFHKTRCTAETMAALQKAQEALQESGAGVELQTEPPAFMKDVALFWQLVMSEDAAAGIRKWAYPHLKKGGVLDHVRIFFDFVKAKMGLKAMNHPFISWGILGAWLFSPNRKKRAEINEFLQTHLKEIEDLLGDNGVFVIPTYPSPAKKHNKIYWEIFSAMKTLRWVMPFIALPNAFGLPAIIVPCGRSEAGLPIGLQVVAKVGNEDLLFRVASYLESRLGGYRRCTDYD